MYKLAAIVLFFSLIGATETKKNDILLASAEHELQRAQAGLATLDPVPYFISYTIHDQSSTLAVASQGGLLNSNQVQRRWADVVSRVGSPNLDNTHGESRKSAIRSGTLPVEDDPDAIARSLWSLIYLGYREAAKA